MDNRQVVLKQYPDGMPAEGDFEIVTGPAPEPGEGQVLCRTRFLSLDPYMRSQIAGRHISGTIAPGDVMRGETVSEVVASRKKNCWVLTVGTKGVSTKGFGKWPVSGHTRLPSYVDADADANGV